MGWVRSCAALVAVGMIGAVLSPVRAADKVTFGTNWVAQAEHGGFYQALAKGIYAKNGLDVTIRPGGPQLNHQQLLIAGRIDFNLGGNSFGAMNYAAQGIPMVIVASLFQKAPEVLIAHPGQGNDSLDALRGKPILLSSEAVSTWFPFLKVAFGFTDAQIRPYTFNLGPFLADKKTIQQGYATSEPFQIAQQGIKPVVMLLADRGYNAYSTTIETSRKLVQTNPDLVQRFVSASIEGWASYMNDDPEPANALIRKDNPEMTDALLAFSRAKMKEYGIVESGDALTLGIGAMTDQRWSEIYVSAASAGLYDKDFDYQKAYTLQFVNKKVGLRP